MGAWGSREDLVSAYSGTVHVTPNRMPGMSWVVGSRHRVKDRHADKKTR